VRIPVAGRRGLVDGSGVGLLGRWIVDCLFVCFLFVLGGGERLMGRKVFSYVDGQEGRLI